MLLLALLPVALQSSPCGAPTALTGEVRDAASGAPVSDVVVEARDARARTSALGRFTIRTVGCDTLRLTRLGYAPASHVVGTDSAPVLVLRPLALPLAAVRVRGSASPHATYTRRAADARMLGGTTAADLAGSLPFVATRTVAGRTSLSVRASRAEQVVVVLDGIPLNDPASGVADPGDIPLVAIAAATVATGSDVPRYGNGATGGVLSLSSAGGTVLSGSLGSLGRRSVEGAWALDRPTARVRIGGAYGVARDDFDFRNVAAAPPADTVERRVNNDLRRASAFLTAVGPRAQLLMLHSDVERGLVGPMNVRAFDRDRGHTSRTLARVASSIGAVEVQAMARRLAVSYASADLPDQSFRVDALSGDLEAAWATGAVALRGGAGADRVGGSRLPRDSRARGFAAATLHERIAGVDATLAVRADLVEHAGAAFTPALTLQRPARVTLTARAAQGFRVPTFYDVYLASPQRITAAVLRPERVTHDLELRAETALPCGTACRGRAELALFDRRTRDAIVWFPGNVGWSPRNVPVEHARGAELHASAERGDVTAAAWGGRYLTRLWDGYLEMRTPYAPYWSAGATLGARRGPLGARFQLRHLGRRPFVNGPPLPELELGPATVVTAGLQFSRATPLGHSILSLTVDDLADARPELVRRYPSPGRTWAATVTIQP